MLVAGLFALLSTPAAASSDCIGDTSMPKTCDGSPGDACVLASSTGAYQDTVTCDFSLGASQEVDITGVYYYDTALGLHELHIYGTEQTGSQMCCIIVPDATGNNWYIDMIGTPYTAGDEFTFDGAHTFRSYDNTATAYAYLDIDADSGDDIIKLPDNNVQHVCSVDGGPGVDTINGSPLFDHIDGGTEADIIDAKGGNDVVIGGLGADEIEGGDGNDIICTVDGGDADVVTAGAGNDTMWEDPSDDVDGDTGTDECRGVGLWDDCSGSLGTKPGSCP